MPRGKPIHFSDAQRGCIAACVEAGITRENIAKAFGVSAGALEKGAAFEIADAAQVALAKVVSNLYQLATTPDPRCTTAAIFYLKARAKWRDGDSPNTRPPIDAIDDMTTNELVAEILRRRSGIRPPSEADGESEPPRLH